MKYHSLKAGPEMNLVYSGESGAVDIIWQIYLLGGYIPKGRLTAAPGVRDGGVDLKEGEYETGFTGYSVTGGMGLHFSINKGVPLIFGFDIYYAHNEMKFKKSLPVYRGADNSSFNEKGIIFAVGTHFLSVKK